MQTSGAPSPSVRGQAGGNEPSDVIACLGVVIQGRRLVESGEEPGQKAFLKIQPRWPTRQHMTRIAIYDTTLRDGSQGEGVNFSLQDKLLITARLDELGVRLYRRGLSALQPQGCRLFSRRARP